MPEEKEEKKEPEQPLVVQPESLAPAFIDPEKEVEYAIKAAKALTTVIANKKRKVMIGGEQYIEFEDWQTIARFYKCSVGIQWVKTVTDLRDKNRLLGFEARANVLRGGEIISSAEASCMKDEKNWADKPKFQLKSMAQTRSCAKALRNVFAWVVVMAGYKPTPAEEITIDQDGFVRQPDQPFPDKPITDKQRKLLTDLLDKAGFKGEEGRKKWEEKVKVKIDELTLMQASDWILKYQKKLNKE